MSSVLFETLLGWHPVSSRATSCLFHHISEVAAAKSLNHADKVTINKYQKSEPDITWNGDINPLSLSHSSLPPTVTPPKGTFLGQQRQQQA
jgi:hypothetical protein